MQLSRQLLEQEKDSKGIRSAGILLDTLPQGFYTKRGKRVLDCIFSATGLLVLLPLFAMVALSIKLTSRGPVFYRQMRVGKDGHPFHIVKFRSMNGVASKMSPGITVSGDKRITRLGMILRRYKIDELPQIWNVLRGDMSLVGPRPELPKYVEVYSPEQKLVLCVRPGITDLASLAYRHEEEILSRHEDPEQVYRMEILPDKLAQNLGYIRNISFRTDLRIIFATIGRSFFLSRTLGSRRNHETTANPP
jgi:lipopolysaccharide/colanic/teichoic acid biosynthesis glycosyltransferase